MIHPLVATAAKHWGLPAPLVQAIVDAEGGEHAIIKAIVPDDHQDPTLSVAIEILCRSLTHRVFDWLIKSANLRAAMAYMASHDDGSGKQTGWAPLGAANDPKGLNRNWPGNVMECYFREGGDPKANG